MEWMGWETRRELCSRPCHAPTPFPLFGGQVRRFCLYAVCTFSVCLMDVSMYRVPAVLAGRLVVGCSTLHAAWH